MADDCRNSSHISGEEDGTAGGLALDWFILLGFGRTTDVSVDELEVCLTYIS